MIMASIARRQAEVWGLVALHVAVGLVALINRRHAGHGTAALFADGAVQLPHVVSMLTMLIMAFLNGLRAKVYGPEAISVVFTPVALTGLIRVEGGFNQAPADGRARQPVAVHMLTMPIMARLKAHMADFVVLIHLLHVEHAVTAARTADVVIVFVGSIQLCRIVHEVMAAKRGGLVATDALVAPVCLIYHLHVGHHISSAVVQLLLPSWHALHMLSVLVLAYPAMLQVNVRGLVTVDVDIAHVTLIDSVRFETDGITTL